MPRLSTNIRSNGRSEPTLCVESLVTALSQHLLTKFPPSPFSGVTTLSILTVRSDAGTECQTRQPILTSDQPNNPNANSNGNKNGISANGGGSNGIDPSAIEQDVKPWLTNGVTV